MRAIDYIVIHCSATRAGQDFGADDIRAWHTKPQDQGGPGWRDIGYHFVIRLDGTLERGRPLAEVGAHVAGYNSHSIGICYVGGYNGAGEVEDTRTAEQVMTMRRLVAELVRMFPKAKVQGHRDFPGVRKACPCFDARQWWAEVVEAEAA